MGEVEKIKDYRVGGLDSRGRSITTILAHDTKFIIYVANDQLELGGETDALDADPETSSLLNRLGEFTPQENKKRLRHYREISAGLAACMAGDSPGARKILSGLLKSKEMRAKNEKRLVYLLGSILVAAAAIPIAWLVQKGSPTPMPRVALGFCSVAAGSLGGILSICLRLRKLEVDIHDGLWFSLALGASRSVVAILGACFVFLGIEAELFLTAVVRAQPEWAPVALGFLSGFSETFVPSLTKKVESAPG